MSKDQKRRTPWLSWLIFAVVVSALVSTTTLSRYITSVSGTGTARVASVEMDGSLEITVSDLTPGASKTVLFSVTNNQNGSISEVAQRYAISIESTENLPLSFSLSTDDTPSTGHALTDGGNNVWSGGELPHTTSVTHTYRLTITWEAANNDPKYADEIDAVKLMIDAQQKNGT